MITSKKTRDAAVDVRSAKVRPKAKPAQKPRRRATKNGAWQVAQPGTKQAALVALLERPDGATIAQICAKTGWQSHSVRAALTGLRKRGVSISRNKNNAGNTVYCARKAA